MFAVGALDLLTRAFDLLARVVVVPELVVAVALSVALCAFVMVSLRRTTGLPLSVSALVVPFVVAAGFGMAFGIHAHLGVPLLHAAGALASSLIPLTIAYERTFGPAV